MKLKATLMVAFLSATAALCGCGKTPDKAAPADTNATGESEAAHEGHSHGDWWCPEHGVPEEICAQCSATVAADLKAKGDWCKEHDRPDSQCFLCHPEKEAEFAAQYEAKYGEKPPKPTAESGEHDGHDHEGHDHDHAEKT